MIFIDDMKNLKIYKTNTFLPTIKGDKKRGSAILLMTPNYEASKKLMNSDLFINSRRYISYYIEKDVSYYIGSKVVEEVDENAIIDDFNEASVCLETKRSELPDDAFGVPSKRKFPLDSEKHVRSAVRFFNYVDPEDEEELARRLIAALKKYDIQVNVGENNRFSKYYKVEKEAKALEESCIPAYHTIYNQIDLFYSMWMNGTMPESEARKKIYEQICNTLSNVNCKGPEDVSTPREYYESLGRLFYEPTHESSSIFNEVSDGLNLGDKIMFFNEDSSKMVNMRLKTLLYNSRIRTRKEVLELLDIVKNDNPWIKYAYPEISRYKNNNLYIDLYFYNAIFFENNTWVNRKGMNLYTEFMKKLINHPSYKSYKKKTIFIPIKEWDKLHNGSVWNFKVNINPISCIYQMLFMKMTRQLRDCFGNIDLIFVGDDKYFKMNFSTMDDKEVSRIAIRFKSFCTKICSGDEFEADDIDSSADYKETPEVIQAKIVDKIENSRGIDITRQVSISNDKKIELAKQIKADGSVSLPKSIKADIRDKSKLSISSNNFTKQTADMKKKVKAELDKEEIEKDMEYDNQVKDEEEDARQAADIAKLADYITQASDSDSEDDAIDQLDNDDIKRILLSLGNDDKVDISTTRASRLTKLEDELMSKEVNGRTIQDILSNEKNKEANLTTINVSSPNKEEWTDISYINFDKNYDIDKDIIAIFNSFSNCTRPIVVRNIKVTDNSTSEDRVALYNVDMEDYRGKRFNIKLDIPIMEDNRFLLRGNYKSIQTQFFNMPIIKTDLGTCQLISNYKKIFLYRFKDNNGTSLPSTSKLIKAAKKYTGRKIKFVTGDNTKVCSKYQLPIDYIDIAGTYSRIETDKYIFLFNQDEIKEKYTIEPNKGFPYLFNKEINAIEYFPVDMPDVSFTDILCEKLFEASSDFEELFDSASRSSVCAYSRASIMSSKIPVAIICGYHIGMRATMDRAKIEYQIVDSISKEIKSNPNMDWIQFADGYIVYKVTYESSLLMNGLKSCSTELYNLEDIDNKSMYLELLDSYGGRIKADGLDNFYDLFVDPMIKESLEYYHLPTDYIDILLYGSSLLADNKYIKHTDTSSRRFRRYQLIAVYTYEVLSTAYGSYATQLKHSRQAAEFSVKQSAVIDAFLTDTITSDDSCINALRDVETTNAVTTKGPSGMNADRAYSLDKRAYDESMVNVLGMSTGFAGNVGITRQATINSNVSPEGYVIDNNGDTSTMNDANTLTATEALIPFGSTRDDPMRTAMSFIQTSKHMVRTEDSDPLLVTNGADEVMPYLTTNKFAYKAKNNGIILELTDTYMIVEYQDGSKDYINLQETTEKNSDGGYFVPLKLDAMEGLKVGTKFKKDQILAYDKYSFSNKLGESNNIAYNIGKLAKVAILNTDEGFEDSGVISSKMATKLATRVDLKYDKVINKDARVFKIAKIGDHIEAASDLLVWEDAFDDEDAEELIASLSKGDVSDIGKRKLKSEVTGVLRDIKIYRTVEIDELSDSLKKIVTEYEKPLKATAAKLKEHGLSIAKVPAHYVLPPNGKLKKAQDAIIIEFYVEYLDTLGVGDKIVYNAANKAVEKSIFPEGKEPYTAFRPNEEVSAFLSLSSISKRLVSSILIYGSLQKLMVELDRSVKDIMGIEYDDSTI